MAVTRTKTNQLLMFISNEFPYSFGIYVKLLEFDMAPIKISIPQSRMGAKYSIICRFILIMGIKKRELCVNISLVNTILNFDIGPVQIEIEDACHLIII